VGKSQGTLMDSILLASFFVGASARQGACTPRHGLCISVILSNSLCVFSVSRLEAHGGTSTGTCLIDDGQSTACFIVLIWSQVILQENNMSIKVLHKPVFSFCTPVESWALEASPDGQ
jgi:hypothetical protein